MVNVMVFGYWLLVLKQFILQIISSSNHIIFISYHLQIISSSNHINFKSYNQLIITSNLFVLTVLITFAKKK
jgi:hypothetical protein